MEKIIIRLIITFAILFIATTFFGLFTYGIICVVNGNLWAGVAFLGIAFLTGTMFSFIGLCLYKILDIQRRIDKNLP